MKKPRGTGQKNNWFLLSKRFKKGSDKNFWEKSLNTIDNKRSDSQLKLHYLFFKQFYSLFQSK